MHSIATLDAALFDPTHGIAGGTWLVDVTVDGILDDRGFVHDFAELKTLVRQVLRQTLDHALLIPVGSSSVHYSEGRDGERWVLQGAGQQAGGAPSPFLWEYQCPRGAVYPIRAVSLRHGVLEQELARLLRHRLPDSIQAIRVKLREESYNPTEAVYRYTHGIASYPGQCQRLFHGHRGRLEVYVGNERRPDHEQFLAREVLGSEVHVAAPAQVLSGSFDLGLRGSPDEAITLGYLAREGRYEAVLPGHRVIVVDGETSIECIARQLACVIRDRELTTRTVRVVCFEGAWKGAIAEQ